MALFTNQAALSYKGNTVNSNIVSGNIVDVLTASKSALTPTYTSNDNITYIVSILNSGNTPISGVSVSDNLGSYSYNELSLTPLSYASGSVAYYQNGVKQATPTVASENPLVIGGLTVPANGNIVLVYEAKTNEYAPLSAQSTITNEVTVNGNGITAPVTALETVTVSPDADLAILKSLSPSTVMENSEITYTLTIQNSGNTAATADDNLTVTDTFTPILSSISVSVNGTALPAASYTYNETTGELTVNNITVPEAGFARDADGKVITTPGETIITITGLI